MFEQQANVEIFRPLVDVMLVNILSILGFYKVLKGRGRVGNPIGSIECRLNKLSLCKFGFFFSPGLGHRLMNCPALEAFVDPPTRF